MALVLGLALVLTTTEDRPDCLLVRGMVCGNVEQVAGGTGLHIAKLVDQGLIGYPREECTNGARVDDIRKGVALF